jgi:hypothetical protein
MMFEWTGYSMVKWLKNDGAVLGKKMQLSHLLDNLCFGDGQHTGQWKVISLCFGNSFWHVLSLNDK